MIDKKDFYRKQLNNYPIKQVKSKLGKKAGKVWNNMDTEKKLITCIKLEKDGDIKREDDKNV